MKRNTFLTLTGFETVLVGLCVFFSRSDLMDDPSDHIIHIIHHVCDLNWSLALIVIGIIAMAIGLTNFKKHHAQFVTLVLLGGLWCAYSFAFVVIDIHFHRSLGILSVLTICVFIRILVEARYGANEGGGR